MYILLKKGKLKEIIQEAIKKAGSQRKFAKDIKIPRSKAWSYQKNNIALKKERLEKILEYIDVKIIDADIEKKLPNNWRQIIGGDNCVKKKTKDNSLNKQLKESRKNIKKTLKEWHQEQKSKNLEEYHICQYEKFKKIANYKFQTKNGEKVRNILEKEIADILTKLKKSYEYEPLVKIENKYFFPDFLIDKKIIIECTMWRGYDKAIKLKEKINMLQKRFKVYVVIPKKLSKYYQSINENLILGINNFEMLIKEI